MNKTAAPAGIPWVSDISVTGLKRLAGKHKARMDDSGTLTVLMLLQPAKVFR